MDKKNTVSLIVSLVFLLFLQLSTLFKQTELGGKDRVNTVTVTPTIIPDVQGSTEEAEVYLVTRVIDGDTIELENGEKLRYIGIDTPENPGSKNATECFAKESFEKNYELVFGKKVRLEKDISERDRYGRLLRYVYVDDIASEPVVFVNDYLVREGYATAVTYPPDIKFSGQFRQAESEARENTRGLWDLCR